MNDIKKVHEKIKADIEDLTAKKGDDIEKVNNYAIVYDNIEYIKYIGYNVNNNVKYVHIASKLMEKYNINIVGDKNIEKLLSTNGIYTLLHFSMIILRTFILLLFLIILSIWSFIQYKSYDIDIITLILPCTIFLFILHPLVSNFLLKINFYKLDKKFKNCIHK